MQPQDHWGACGVSYFKPAALMTTHMESRKGRATLCRALGNCNASCMRSIPGILSEGDSNIDNFIMHE